MKRLVFAAAAVCLVPFLYPSQASAISVNIAGTHTVTAPDFSSGNYKPFKIDTSVLFDPLSGPVTVTGAVDIGGLSGNSTTYFGLIAKHEYDQWLAEGHDPNNSQTDFFGFIDTAYAGFNTSSAGRLGLGQHLPNFDAVQSYVADNLGTSVSQFTVTFNGTDMTLDLGADQVMQIYQDTLDYPEWENQGFPALPNRPTRPTDWTNGAYAFVGTWFDGEPGSSTVDLLFEGPELSAIPEPGTLALFGLGLAGLGFARRKRSARA